MLDYGATQREMADKLGVSRGTIRYHLRVNGWFSPNKGPSRYTKEALEEAVAQEISFAGVIRRFGLRQSGSNQTYISQRIRHFGIDTSHFTGQSHSRGTISTRRKVPDAVLIVLPAGSHRPRRAQLARTLTDLGVSLRCNRCGLGDQWNGRPLVLEINHISGDWLDNRRENLEFLCPNCHSQETETNRRGKYGT